jgi:hypothetical protein
MTVKAAFARVLPIMMVIREMQEINHQIQMEVEKDLWTTSRKVTGRAPIGQAMCEKVEIIARAETIERTIARAGTERVTFL